MQVYLPHKNFRKCANILDTDTLYNQRNSIEKIIYFTLVKLKKIELEKEFIKDYSKTIKNPIFLFWWNQGIPYLPSILKYWDVCNFELFNRKFKLRKLSVLTKIIKNLKSEEYFPGNPPTPKRITSGYRIILLCKNEEYYSDKYFATFKKNKKLINKLRNSKKKFKFSKFLGLK